MLEKLTIKVIPFFLVISLLLTCLVPVTTIAHNKVVVIPMFESAVKPENLILVAKNNGDFDNPVDAMNSITDASEDNRYRIHIEPGQFQLTERLIMKEWVDVIGSGSIGENRRTSLLGSSCTTGLDAGSSIVEGAANSGISSLIIVNIGTGGINTNCIALYVSDGDFGAENVVLLSQGGVNNIGIVVDGSGTASFANTLVKIDDEDAEDNIALISTGDSRQILIFLSEFSGIKANSDNLAIFNASTTSLIFVFNSSIEGGNFSVRNFSGTVDLNEVLEKGGFLNSGTMECSDVASRDAFSFYTSGCLFPPP